MSSDGNVGVPSSKLELCHCDLSGDIHIIRDGKCCEVCVAADRMPYTPENVEKAFVWYQTQITSLMEKVENDNEKQVVGTKVASGD